MEPPVRLKRETVRGWAILFEQISSITRTETGGKTPQSASARQTTIGSERGVGVEVASSLRASQFDTGELVAPLLP